MLNKTLISVVKLKVPIKIIQHFNYLPKIFKLTMKLLLNISISCKVQYSCLNHGKINVNVFLIKRYGDSLPIN